MLHHHVPTVAQNGQTLVLERAKSIFNVFAAAVVETEVYSVGRTLQPHCSLPLWPAHWTFKQTMHEAW